MKIKTIKQAENKGFFSFSYQNVDWEYEYENYNWDLIENKEKKMKKIYEEIDLIDKYETLLRDQELEILKKNNKKINHEKVLNQEIFKKFGSERLII
jgi:hypothetical protein